MPTTAEPAQHRRTPLRSHTHVIPSDANDPAAPHYHLRSAPAPTAPKPNTSLTPRPTKLSNTINLAAVQTRPYGSAPTPTTLADSLKVLAPACPLAPTPFTLYLRWRFHASAKSPMPPSSPPSVLKKRKSIARASLLVVTRVTNPAPLPHTSPDSPLTSASSTPHYLLLAPSFWCSTLQISIIIRP